MCVLILGRRYAGWTAAFEVLENACFGPILAENTKAAMSFVEYWPHKISGLILDGAAGTRGEILGVVALTRELYPDSVIVMAEGEQLTISRELCRQLRIDPQSRNDATWAIAARVCRILESKSEDREVSSDLPNYWKANLQCFLPSSTRVAAVRALSSDRTKCRDIGSTAETLRIAAHTREAIRRSRARLDALERGASAKTC